LETEEKLRYGCSIRDRTAARVTEIIPRGEFATWRAARVVGRHDLNKFLMRVDPALPAAVLRPE